MDLAFKKIRHVYKILVYLESTNLVIDIDMNNYVQFAPLFQSWRRGRKFACCAGQGFP